MPVIDILSSAFKILIMITFSVSFMFFMQDCLLYVLTASLYLSCLCYDHLLLLLSPSFDLVHIFCAILNLIEQDFGLIQIKKVLDLNFT